MMVDFAANFSSCIHTLFLIASVGRVNFILVSAAPENQSEENFVPLLCV